MSGFTSLLMNIHCEGIWKRDGVTSLLLTKLYSLHLNQREQAMAKSNFQAEISEHLNMSWQEQ